VTKDLLLAAIRKGTIEEKCLPSSSLCLQKQGVHLLLDGVVTACRTHPNAGMWRWIFRTTKRVELIAKK
jgi:hypothetical protein